MGTGVYAEFESADAMLKAVEGLRAEGYRALETFAPFDVPGTSERLALRRSPLPTRVFIGGLVGAIVAYWVQWYANAWSYPQNAGGRPPHAVPAFIFSTFEGMVLLGALTAFVGLFAILGLPRLWHPAFEIEGIERATVDRFWVAIGREDPRYDAERSARELEAAGALRVVRVEAG